ncbi:hypothetical protein F5Y11DRAFT_364616 [Daldinia sp. FL1419]|nr:hypothetical protein F5Y11DRAFT_364616 [Daldinia sp. FL1419]
MGALESRMGHSEANVNPGCEISGSVNQKEPDLERNAEKVDDVEIVTEIREQLRSDENAVVNSEAALSSSSSSMQLVLGEFRSDHATRLGRDFRRLRPKPAAVILADMATLEERSKYLGLMAIPSAVGNITGPNVGGLFATYATWRWIGWINLPFLGIGTPLVFFFLKLRPVPLYAKLAKNSSRLDCIGVALAIIGITIFVIPISWAGSLFPWASWQTLVPMLLGVVVLVLFGFYEARPAAIVTLLGWLIHGMVLGALLQYSPLLYQAPQLETAISAALSLLPTYTISTLFAAIAMMMVPLFGGYVRLLRLS